MARSRRPFRPASWGRGRFSARPATAGSRAGLLTERAQGVDQRDTRGDVGPGRLEAIQRSPWQPLIGPGPCPAAIRIEHGAERARGDLSRRGRGALQRREYRLGDARCPTARSARRPRRQEQAAKRLVPTPS